MRAPLTNFRFEYLRIGKSIRTDRQIQIFNPEGKVFGHIDAEFAEWLLAIVLKFLDLSKRQDKLLLESLDDAIADSAKHKRCLREHRHYEKRITHKP